MPEGLSGSEATRDTSTPYDSKPPQQHRPEGVLTHTPDHPDLGAQLRRRDGLIGALAARVMSKSSPAIVSPGNGSRGAATTRSMLMLPSTTTTSLCRGAPNA